MKILEENNEYEIKYDPLLDRKELNSDIWCIYGYLSDKKTKAFFTHYEEYSGNLEQCLMKLGKNLLKKYKEKKFYKY